jgi:hypothetical protein
MKVIDYEVFDLHQAYYANFLITYLQFIRQNSDELSLKPLVIIFILFQ